MKKRLNGNEFDMYQFAKKFQRAVSNKIAMENKIQNDTYIAPKHRIKDIEQE